MKFLPISLLFIISVFSSCSLATTKNLVEEKTKFSVVKNNYFANVQTDYVYKTSINIYGNYFGGIMIFKKLKNNYHRIVFTTEFGNKILDFELENNFFKKNFIIDKLDKKLIVNTLKKDFKMLLQENNKVTNFYTNAHYKVYKTEQNKQFNFYFISKKNNLLKKIVRTTKYKEKVTILFSEIENNTSKKISINHKNIALVINLKYLK